MSAMKFATFNAQSSGMMTARTLLLIPFFLILSENANAQCTLFNVGGGGPICSGATGVNVTLSGSQTGVNYQLKIGGTNVGAAMPGTGGGLNWTNMTAAGTYTVTASCLATM